MMAASNVPNSWDEEDWVKLADKPPPPPTFTSRRPNPAAVPFNPPTGPRLLRASAPEFDNSHLLYTPSAGGVPKTLYKPDLKILKRTPEVPGVTLLSAPNPSEEVEKERRERERKDRERRYKEARERIMGDTKDPDTKGKKTKNGKRSPDTPRSRTPKPASPAPPSRKPSPSSSITSFSLNGGDFTAPTRFARDLDGKLLESQALRVRGGQETSPTTTTSQASPAGLDWDSFSRDEGWSWGNDMNAVGACYPADYGHVHPRQQNPGIYGGTGAGFPAVTASGYNVYAQPYMGKVEKQTRGAPGVVQAVRAPRGPDADGGRGFKGRGISGVRVQERV